MASATPTLELVSRLRLNQAVIALGVAWIILALVWMPATAFTVDGYLSLSMAEAMVRNLSFFIANGYADNPSPALDLPLFIPHDGRLAPQYPGGWGVVAAPAYWIGGARGIMVFNAALGVGTIWLVFATARRLFDDPSLALHAALIFAGASFAIDYAIGMWTHASSLFASALAVYTIARAAQTNGLIWALMAGVALGAGMNIRVDVAFPAAAILIWSLVGMQRPYRAAGLILLGMAPGLVCATLINEFKFGVATPFTYGAGGGRVSLDYYSGLLPLVIAGVTGAALLGLTPVRSAMQRPAIWALCAAIAVAAVLISGAAQVLLGRVIAGGWTLIVDFQDYRFKTRGLSFDEEGRLIAFGHLKRALLQSAPYLTVITAAIPLLFAKGGNRGAWLLVMVTGATIAPFAYGAWFGGMANSMRYFLHCLPAVSILSALGLQRLGGTSTPLIFAVCLGLSVAFFLHLAGGMLDDIAPWWSILGPDALIMISAILVLLTLVLGRNAPRWLQLNARLSVYAGVVLATAIAWGADLRNSFKVRDLHARFAANAQVVPDNALLATFRLQYFPLRVNSTTALTSYVKFADPQVSEDLAMLVMKSFSEDRPVYIHGIAAAQTLIDKGAAGSATPLFGVNEYSDLYVMTPPD